MSQYTNEMCVLARNIASGIYTKKEAVKKIHELQMQYPDEFDAPGCVKRKEKPWDMEYLKELENFFYHGAPSCAFLEYMAEVADEVYRAKRIRKSLCFIAAFLALCIAAFVLIWKIVRR